MNKPKALVLCGKGSSGKTTTLNLLIDLLSEVAEPEPINDQTKRAKDHFIRFEWSGKRILVITAGDLVSVFDSFREKIFPTVNPYDLCVFAARSYGKTIDWIKHQFEDKQVITMEKSAIKTIIGPSFKGLEEFRDKANKTQATWLFEIIESLLFAD